MKSYRKNYLGLRFKAIPTTSFDDGDGESIATAADVRDTLKLDKGQFTRWRKLKTFNDARICFQWGEGRAWFVRLDRLYNWLVYIGAIKERGVKIVNGQQVRQNPPMNANQYRKRRKEEAKEKLGLRLC